MEVQTELLQIYVITSTAIIVGLCLVIAYIGENVRNSESMKHDFKKVLDAKDLAFKEQQEASIKYLNVQLKEYGLNVSERYTVTTRKVK